MSLRRAALAAGCATACWAMVSCGQGKATGSRVPQIVGKDLKTLSRESERDDSGPAVAPLMRIGPVEASRGVGDVEVYVGAPVVTLTPEEREIDDIRDPLAVWEEEGAQKPGAWADTGAPAGGSTLIDSMVGQINGRPVFASQFFAPMDARLRAEARTLKPNEWVRFAQQQVRSALFEKMRDELLLAEFQSSLNPQQRLGVLAFVETLRSNLVSESFGSEELAKRRLMEEEGLTIEEKVRAQRDRELIRVQIMRVLESRAYVPWREVVLEYERDADKYRPPPRVALRLIRVPADNPAAAERVAAALAAGEPFADVASRESSFASSNGGLYEVTLKTSDYESAEIFGDAILNKKAQALTVGEVVGPFENGPHTAWLMLETIERPPPVSLYDEQLAIHADLKARRLSEEERRYFLKLIENASISNMEEMERRLLQIAVDRYFPEVEGARR